MEKMESNKLKTFQKPLEWIKLIPQYNQSRQSQSRRGNVFVETDQELIDTSGNTWVPK